MISSCSNAGFVEGALGGQAAAAVGGGVDGDFGVDLLGGLGDGGDVVGGLLHGFLVAGDVGVCIGTQGLTGVGEGVVGGAQVGLCGFAVLG